MIARLIATAGYIGYLKPAPGTWASALAIPLAWAIHGLASFPGLMLATLALCAAGWWATKRMTAGQEHHDPSEIVIDEIVGMWIALWPLSLGMMLVGAPTWSFPWPGWVTAFIAFRLFDITKPGPVGWADRRADALGVILDDVIAGIMAAIVVIVLAALSHMVLM